MAERQISRSFGRAFLVSILDQDAVSPRSQAVPRESACFQSDLVGQRSVYLRGRRLVTLQLPEYSGEDSAEAGSVLDAVDCESP